MDMKGISLATITFIGWINFHITKGDAVFFITIMAGLTTIVYNLIKIKNSFKK